MKNHAIRCYERELGNAVHGIRLRRKIKESFRRSLLLFLEDVEEPTYEVNCSILSGQHKKAPPGRNIEF